jgi:hypothetical protein
MHIDATGVAGTRFGAMSGTGEGRSTARASVTAVTGVLAAVGLLLVMLTWAATIGPDEIVAGGRAPSYDEVSPTAVENTDAGADAPESERERNDLVWRILTFIAVALATVVTLAAVLNLIRWLLTRDWRWRRRERDPEELAFETLGAPALARTMTQGAQAQRRALELGNPRNAIVECWHRFEQHAATAGIERAPWETSSEFTLRVLDDVSADPVAVSELAGLYRDARHSAHEITEESRARARDALDRILGSLGAASGVS